jgi:hypothetical protein
MESIETLKTYEELLAAGKEAGIKDSKLERAVELYSLPLTGTFKKLILRTGTNEAGDNMSHFAMITTTDEIISMSALQRFGYFGAKAEAESNIQPKQDKQQQTIYTLRGVSCKNPKLTGNHIKVGLKLEGTSFNADPKEGWILDYKKEGYTTLDGAKKGLVTKVFYEVSPTDVK